MTNKPPLADVRESLGKISRMKGSIDKIECLMEISAANCLAEQALTTLDQIRPMIEGMKLEFKPEYNDGNHDTALTMVTMHNAAIDKVLTALYGEE